MKNKICLHIVLMMCIFVLFSGCNNKKPESNNKNANKPQQTQSPKQDQTSQTPKQTFVTLTDDEIQKIKPNESGQVMVVMFHNFIESYVSGDKEYTTTFSDFKKLLQTLYDQGYRPVNLNEYLSNNFNVPAGFSPMVFTFDDATSGQFNLIESNGKLIANPNTAVGIMSEFNKTHPDFGLKGTFYVNLGLETFSGKGTLEERLRYLIDQGFEIGNHTLNHVHLPSIKDADKIKSEVGGNQKKMFEIIKDYQFKTLSLPYGQATKNLEQFVISGDFEGIPYENKGLMLVGANPAPAPISKNFKPYAIPRVRSTGLKLVECDLDWWLKNLSKNLKYISDGNADTITIPKSNEKDIDNTKLANKKLITY